MKLKQANSQLIQVLGAYFYFRCKFGNKESCNQGKEINPVSLSFFCFHKIIHFVAHSYNEIRVQTKPQQPYHQLIPAIS